MALALDRLLKNEATGYNPIIHSKRDSNTSDPTFRTLGNLCKRDGQYSQGLHTKCSSQNLLNNLSKLHAPINASY
ncbi:hypothetical protein HC248_01354 [Polaromonas vacuolata]|uniref:Uncharacterized protein n=1 Tax=Polaromonas vacuolata TaxID=37448 RepID=A0A6H2H8B8_9BURK|nr:hypothetical protein HC248_01354 [Polaromonas vacuolata]